jgi:glycosyltransferase involved in cell wall biosynthesis
MKPTVHLYTICWNEEKFLDFFFRHYDSLVDEYHIYDDGSDDGTLQILSAHPKVQVYSFETTEDSYVLSAQKYHENFWKASKHRADWVIVTAIDELLYHPNLENYLLECSAMGVSAIPAIGFQMISAEYPLPTKAVTSQISSGAFWRQMSKLSIFDPMKIEETNFSTGRHQASPTGNVTFPKVDELLNLHYKYLSFNQTYQRHIELGDKLRGFDVELNAGHKYRWSRDELLEDWQYFESHAVDDVFDLQKVNAYLDSLELLKWWRN